MLLLVALLALAPPLASGVRTESQAHKICALRQERLTHQLADAIATATSAAGVLIVVEARHLCMVARGVEKHAAGTTTIACRGTLADDSATRAELMLTCCVT